MLKEGLPSSLQALKFAANKMEVSAQFDPYRLKRLQSLLIEDPQKTNEGQQNQIQVVITGDINEVGEKRIQLNISGKVYVQCQTCFEPMAIDVNSTVNLVPVFTDEQASSLESGTEPLMLDDNAHFVPEDLVEDEMILSIPVTSNHPQDECKVALDEYVEEIEATDEESESPFAALAEMKKNLTLKKQE